MLKIAAAVILYNPDNSILSNVASYITQVEKLYAIDNSEIPTGPEILNDIKTFDKVIYINNNSNQGLSSALNHAANLAARDGFDLLLTMDQDSYVSENLISEMLVEFERIERLGILAPFVVHIENPKKPSFTGLEKITVAMTSGSVIRLSALREIGGFLEKLFIDYVDNELCLRMQMYKYEVLQLNSVFLYHRLGNVQKRNLLFKKIFPTNHDPLRLYYRTRNRLYVYKVYREKFIRYISDDRKSFVKELLKILFYEKYKYKKYKMILLGYLDHRRNRYGKYPG